MARYAAIELSVSENGDLRFPEKFSKEERDKLQRGDVVYIYYGTKSKKMYIGQTSRFIYRHSEHYSKDISFPPADFNSVVVLYSQLFNKSSILDVEKQLINYFLAETPKKSARKILFDEDSLINKTTGDHVNEYTDRILAVLVEKWKQTDGKDSSVMHWHEGSIHRRRNSTQENRLNSGDKDAAAQIGSVFAVQGNDLNKVEVLIGADIEVDENGKLKADPQNFHNTNGKFSVDETLESENQREFTLFVLNIYYVLLTRGIDGIRIGFWHNDAFMKYMEETLEINREDV